MANSIKRPRPVAMRKRRKVPVQTRVTFEDIEAAKSINDEIRISDRLAGYDWLSQHPALNAEFSFKPPQTAWGDPTRLCTYARAYVCKYHWGVERFWLAREVVRGVKFLRASADAAPGIERRVSAYREIDRGTLARMAGEVISLRASLASDAESLDDKLPPLDAALARVLGELKSAATVFEAANYSLPPFLPAQGDSRQLRTEIRRAIQDAIPDLPPSRTTWAAFAIAVRIDDDLPSDAMEFQEKFAHRWGPPKVGKLGKPKPNR